jgi:choice-of-anchor B domain-containing protein
MKLVMQLKNLERQECELLNMCPEAAAQDVSALPCVNGKAGEYDCNNVDLEAFVSLSTLGSLGSGNDIWGWEDTNTGDEYALFGATDGTSFIDVTNPQNPRVLGFLPSHNQISSTWRDIKVYNNHAFIISEASGHGMQVFALERLTRAKANSNLSYPITFDADAHYDEFGNCHNIVINEDTAMAYCVGSRTCRGGPHMMSIHQPLNPQFVGCYSEDGYTHDAQFVVYHGPDERFDGHEIGFLYNEDSLTIADFQDKSNVKMLSRVVYDGVAYSHQGWLTEDQGYLLLDDELDEMQGKNDGFTQTYMWDVRDLENPKVIGHYYAVNKAVDHNMYTLGNLVFQANYESGLRILDISDVANANIEEVGFFDVHPTRTQISFNGAWSVWPYFKSGTIVVSSINRGLFVLRQK